MLESFKNLTDANKTAIVVSVGIVVIAGSPYSSISKRQ